MFEAHTNKQIMDEEKVAAGVVKVQEDSGIHSMEIFKWVIPQNTFFRDYSLV